MGRGGNGNAGAGASAAPRRADRRLVRRRRRRVPRHQGRHRARARHRHQSRPRGDRHARGESPGTKHYCEDVWKVDPREACRGRRPALAWFSPDCKHFSKAKGGKPVDKNIRGLAWLVILWAKTVKPARDHAGERRGVRGLGPARRRQHARPAAHRAHLPDLEGQARGAGLQGRAPLLVCSTTARRPRASASS
jgi:hypothetical protein